MKWPFSTLVIHLTVLGHKTVGTEESIWGAITRPKDQKEGLGATENQNV